MKKKDERKNKKIEEAIQKYPELLEKRKKEKAEQEEQSKVRSEEVKNRTAGKQLPLYKQVNEISDLVDEADRLGAEKVSELRIKLEQIQNMISILQFDEAETSLKGLSDQVDKLKQDIKKTKKNIRKNVAHEKRDFYDAEDDERFEKNRQKKEEQKTQNAIDREIRRSQEASSSVKTFNMNDSDEARAQVERAKQMAAKVLKNNNVKRTSVKPSVQQEQRDSNLISYNTKGYIDKIGDMEFRDIMGKVSAIAVKTGNYEKYQKQIETLFSQLAGNEVVDISKVLNAMIDNPDSKYRSPAKNLTKIIQNLPNFQNQKFGEKIGNIRLDEIPVMKKYIMPASLYSKQDFDEFIKIEKKLPHNKKFDETYSKVLDTRQFFDNLIRQGLPDMRVDTVKEYISKNINKDEQAGWWEKNIVDRIKNRTLQVGDTGSGEKFIPALPDHFQEMAHSSSTADLYLLTQQKRKLKIPEENIKRLYGIVERAEKKNMFEHKNNKKWNGRWGNYYPWKQMNKKFITPMQQIDEDAGEIRQTSDVINELKKNKLRISQKGLPELYSIQQGIIKYLIKDKPEGYYDDYRGFLDKMVPEDDRDFLKSIQESGQAKDYIYGYNKFLHRVFPKNKQKSTMWFDWNPRDWNFGLSERVNEKLSISPKVDKQTISIDNRYKEIKELTQNPEDEKDFLSFSTLNASVDKIEKERDAFIQLYENMPKNDQY